MRGCIGGTHACVVVRRSDAVPDGFLRVRLRIGGFSDVGTICTGRLWLTVVLHAGESVRGGWFNATQSVEDFTKQVNSQPSTLSRRVSSFLRTDAGCRWLCLAVLRGRDRQRQEDPTHLPGAGRNVSFTRRRLHPHGLTLDRRRVCCSRQAGQWASMAWKKTASSTASSRMRVRATTWRTEWQLVTES